MQKRHTLNFQHDSFTRASVGSRHSIITPSDNSSVTLPATVTIAANATDSDGSITKVDFYSNAILMSTASTAPYSVTLAGFTLGSYTFTAVATDNSGASTTAAPVHISIVNGASQVYYIHTDQLNTPRLITDSNNAKVWEWSNDDPFGNNPPNDDPNATGRHFSFNQRFAGQYADKETGTNYNYLRDIYFTDLGRYGQFDPIGFAGGSMSPYAYVGGNPISRIDPNGLVGLAASAAEAAALGGLIGSVGSRQGSGGDRTGNSDIDAALGVASGSSGSSGSSNSNDWPFDHPRPTTPLSTPVVSSPPFFPTNGPKNCDKQFDEDILKCKETCAEPISPSRLYCVAKAFSRLRACRRINNPAGSNWDDWGK